MMTNSAVFPILKTSPKHLSLGAIGWGISLMVAVPAMAVAPATVAPDADVSWSAVIDHPFDGKIVYDKHFTDDFAFVTSWSNREIRASYIKYWREFTGYRVVYQESQEKVCLENRYRRDHCREYTYITRRRPKREATYANRSEIIGLRTLYFSVRQKLYTYHGGAVPQELGLALANAPEGNMLVRAELNNGEVIDLPIGEGTVRTWRSIFAY
ncbi:MAG: hypothetical protein WCO45_06255 [Pseudanabaena sp. ELA607]